MATATVTGANSVLMIDQFPMGKRALAALFLIFLCSCSDPCRQWEYDDTITCYPCYNSGRITLPSDGSFCGVITTIARDANGISLFIDTTVLSFPAEDSCPLTAYHLSIDGSPPRTLYATRLQGSQRLLLDEEATQLVIDALLNGACVEITIGQFHTTLISDDFAKKWCDLMNLPL